MIYIVMYTCGFTPRLRGKNTGTPNAADQQREIARR